MLEYGIPTRRFDCGDNFEFDSAKIDFSSGGAGYQESDYISLRNSFSRMDTTSSKVLETNQSNCEAQF